MFSRAGVVVIFGVVACLLVSLALAKAQVRPVTREKVRRRMDLPQDRKDSGSQDYAGDQACRSCHLDKFNSYRETAHHFTSQLPSSKSIAGSFAAGGNELHTSNPSLHFSMRSTPHGFFQSAVEQLPDGKSVSHSERFDVVIGSGRKGQSYLFWSGDQLFELPVSYWTELKSWINSPGYPDGWAHFDRPVVPRCLECHASSFKVVQDSMNEYERNSLILGINCERCHGAGGAHVQHRSAKIATENSDLINLATMPRERQIDLCGLCHSGLGTSIAPVLSFVAGDDLHKFLIVPDAGSSAPVDVHGNQVELMERSRCFQSSNMTCTTCHDVHTRQRDAASFSVHCLSCHQAASHPKLSHELGNNCVDCHMPLQESNTLVSGTNGKVLKPLVRNHQIGIYRRAE